MIKGIDVSKWQGDINWKKVKNSGIKFAILRATYGTDNVDPYFKKNITEALNAGIDTGAYHYSYAINTYEAEKEAEHFLNTVKPYKMKYPLVLDIEDKTQSSLGKDKITDICIAFLSKIEKAGYYSMIYTNKNWFETKLDIDRLKNYDKWLAQYNDVLTYTEEIGIWQYSDKGKINGINGNVDMNISYKDYSGIIETAGLNNLKEVSDMENSEKNDTLNVEQAKKIIQDKCGFDDNTMMYLSFYKYSDSLIIRLAQAIK